MPSGNFIRRFDNQKLRCQIRVIDRNGQPWFVGNDVAKSLGYARPRDAVREFCKGGAKMALPSNCGMQETMIIPEADVFRLIMRSKLPHAEAFQDWVVEEVLPAIRKHGGYLTPAAQEEARRNPESIYQLAEALIEERERRQLAEDRVEVFRPREPYGTPSRINGEPRTSLVPAFFRSLRNRMIREIDEYQRRLFDFQ